MLTTRRFALWLIVLFLVTLLAPLPAFAQGGKQHVVQPGENLFRIALRYGITVNALASANNIPNSSIVYVGQVLNIPGSAEPAAPPAEAVNVSSPPSANTGSATHIVGPGDTLNRIARKYGVTVQAIMAANGITDPNRILLGQQLIIPGQPAPPAQPETQSLPPAPTSAPAQVNQPAASARTHVVKRGEGLAAIGRQYGVTWTAIAAYNNITNPNLIYAGMVLKIPEAGYMPANGPAPESRPDAPVSTGKLILVVLREQRVYAYENGKLLRSTLVSTGLPAFPTVTGQYKIYVKYKAQTMSGPGYYLPNVPYVMYFYRGYGLHGTYWHSNFGRPMSHGCVNLPTPQAQWFFNWAEVGTPVHVRW